MWDGGSPNLNPHMCEFTSSGSIPGSMGIMLNVWLYLCLQVQLKDMAFFGTRSISIQRQLLFVNLLHKPINQKSIADFRMRSCMIYCDYSTSQKHLPILTLYTKEMCSLCDDAKEVLEHFKHRVSVLVNVCASTSNRFVDWALTGPILQCTKDNI